MNTLNQEYLRKINEPIFRHASSSTDVGLLNGKMGVTIYAYHASRTYENLELQELAEKMLEDVIGQLETSDLQCGFEDGLSGIVFGFEYLARNRFIFPEGEDAFRDMDDRLFRTIVASESIPIGLSGISGYLFYLYPKIAWGDPASATTRYNKRLVIDLINKLYQKIYHAENDFHEPLAFNFLWNLPLILFSLGKMVELHVYNRKIRRTVQQLAPYVLSLSPKLHSNKLYLLLGMKVLNSLSIPGWSEHISFLEQSISMNRIIHEELKNRAIAVKNGISGISLICNHLSMIDFHNPFSVATDDLERKISESEYWSPQTEDNVGILFGQAGMGLALLMNRHKTFEQ